MAIRKSSGVSQTLMPRIDAAEGLSDCDDIDNSTHLEVSADGSQAFASFDSGGLWRLRPSPLQFLDSSYFEDVFRLHPDGSVVFATVRDGPTTATVNVFKISASQVAGGRPARQRPAALCDVSSSRTTACPAGPPDSQPHRRHRRLPAHQRLARRNDPGERGDAPLREDSLAVRGGAPARRQSHRPRHDRLLVARRLDDLPPIGLINLEALGLR